MKNTPALFTIAWIGAMLSHAQNWTYSPNPDKITHSTLPWVFNVTVTNGTELIVTDCLAGPPVGTSEALPLGDPVEGGYGIVKIINPKASSARTGGVLGNYHSRANALPLPKTLVTIGECGLTTRRASAFWKCGNNPKKLACKHCPGQATPEQFQFILADQLVDQKHKDWRLSKLELNP